MICVLFPVGKPEPSGGSEPIQADFQGRYTPAANEP